MKLALVVTLLAALAIATEVPCTVYLHYPKEHTTWFYDLSRLYHPPNQADTLYYRDSMGSYYYVNFCGRTTTSCDKASVCQRATNYRYYSLGSTYTQFIGPTSLASAGRGVDVTYSLGDRCDTFNRSTTIHVICNENANPGYFFDETETDCEYELYLYSAAGCGVLM